MRDVLHSVIRVETHAQLHTYSMACLSSVRRVYATERSIDVAQGREVRALRVNLN